MASAVYRRIILVCDRFVPERFLPLWNSNAGPKTVFFWAPLFKWGLVVASIGDYSRPAEQLSVRQSLSLGLTGIIWSRYSLVIIPKNYGLFSVNLFVGITNLYQSYRAISYQNKLEKMKKEEEGQKLLNEQNVIENQRKTEIVQQ